MPTTLTSSVIRKHGCRLERCASSTLAEWFLKENQDKTEYVHLFRGKDRIQEERRRAKKLCSVLGVDQGYCKKKAASHSGVQFNVVSVEKKGESS